MSIPPPPSLLTLAEARRRYEAGEIYDLQVFNHVGDLVFGMDDDGVVDFLRDDHWLTLYLYLPADEFDAETIHAYWFPASALSEVRVSKRPVES